MVRIAGRKERVKAILKVKKTRGGCHHDNRPSSSKIMKLILHIGIFQNTRTYEEKQRFPRFTTKESLNSV